MIDIDEIRKRAQQASQQTVSSVKETMEKNEERISKMEAPCAEKSTPPSPGEEEQINANAQRQVEILGQIFSADTMAQMAANEKQMQEMISNQVAQASLTTENLMEQLLGEDMGVLAAALETLSMDDASCEEEPYFTQELEEGLYTVLEETMARIASLPEPEPVPYQKADDKWEQFGIFLSGIVSNLNGHSLWGMDVEEHIPVMEQQVVSIVRRSWGIDGRRDLLDMLRYLTQEGYILRYQLYSEAASPQELMDETMDEEDCEAAARVWRFAQRYKSQYAPGFMAGWDLGRAAMLTRWGCYLGWLTEGEARSILWDLSQKAVGEIHSWREFAQSYVFGGLMWKLLCGDSSAESYLGYVANAAANLLAGKKEEEGGQWRHCPWPAQRKLGFTL